MHEHEHKQGVGDALLGRDAGQRVAKDAEVQRGLAAAQLELLTRVDDEGVGGDGVVEASFLHLAGGRRVVVVHPRVRVREHRERGFVEMEVVASAIAPVVARDGRVVLNEVVPGANL